MSLVTWIYAVQLRCSGGSIRPLHIRKISARAHAAAMVHTDDYKFLRFSACCSSCSVKPVELERISDWITFTKSCQCLSDDLGIYQVLPAERTEYPSPTIRVPQYNALLVLRLDAACSKFPAGVYAHPTLRIPGQLWCYSSVKIMGSNHRQSRADNIIVV